MATTWTLDAAHSDIDFKVKHMMIANVKGKFEKFDITINGDDILNATAEVKIDAASVNTNNTDRDNHLKNHEFFDVEKYPTITFVSKSLTNTSGDDYKLVGDLTIKDVTKEVVLDVEYGGLAKDPWGNNKAGFTVEGKISRKDFGLTWNAALETGGVMVGDDVKIAAEVQFVQAQA